MTMVLGWMLFTVWLVVSGIPTIWFMTRTLKRQSDCLQEPAQWPTLSVVVPARDEAHKIESGLRSLLASDYPNLEIIAVDDRSRDETGAIMDRLAAEFSVASPRKSTDIGEASPILRVIHITELPTGWLGKNHALQTGSEQARGDWILFTDGDVVYESETLRRAVRYAIGRGIDHLPLFPNIEAHSLFETAFVAFFGLMFTAGTQPPLVSSRWPWFYVGVGAFNLVRRSALKSAGGFEPIRLDVMDDVKLGKLLKRTGSRCDVLRAGSGLSVRWQQSAWKCITGLEKNAFASADYSVIHLIWMLGTTAIVFLGPLVGLFLGGEARWGYLAALILSHAIYGVNSVQFGHSFWIFPLMIPSGFAFIFAFVRSAWITLRQQGVRWRDTFYPLSVLRQHVYR